MDGQSSDDATPILDAITGKVTKTQLAQDLLSEIQSFAPPFAGSDDDYAGSEEIFAGIQSIQSLQQEGDLALAQQQTTLQAQIGQNTALVQQTASAMVALDGRISAAWSIKVGITQDGKYYGAGMAIGIDNESGPVQSQILFQADRFALLNVANGVVTSPFVVQGGQVFINQALIGTGWITSAMIGQLIQSDDYVPGQKGWRLDKAGTYENNGSGTGGRRVDTNLLTQIFYPNGQLAVRMGVWG